MWSSWLNDKLLTDIILHTVRLQFSVYKETDHCFIISWPCLKTFVLNTHILLFLTLSLINLKQNFVNPAFQKTCPIMNAYASISDSFMKIIQFICFVPQAFWHTVIFPKVFWFTHCKEVKFVVNFHMMYLIVKTGPSLWAIIPWFEI